MVNHIGKWWLNQRGEEIDYIATDGDLRDWGPPYPAEIGAEGATKRAAT